MEKMKQKRILIIEDELQIVMTLCQALVHPMAGKHQVEVCPLADVAMKRLQYEQFDLVVTDLRMPGMNGLELLRHVHQTSPQTRKMLITAFGSPELEDQVRRLGAVYLPKPFDLQEFVVAVQRALNEEEHGGRGEQT
jgi:two-component system response regulator (stage 0 sporulation protein F)